MDGITTGIGGGAISAVGGEKRLYRELCGLRAMLEHIEVLLDEADAIREYEAEKLKEDWYQLAAMYFDVFVYMLRLRE